MHRPSETPMPNSLRSSFPREGEIDLRAKSLKEILALEEKNELFKAGEIALKTNPNARTTFSGRVIQNNRGGHTNDSGEQKNIDVIFTQLAFSGMSLETLYSFTSKIASLAAIFTPSVAAKPAAPESFADAHNVYDTERVTAETYKILKEESTMIALREQALSSIDDPDIYMQELQEFAELANSLDMRPHPLTGNFIHSHERVRELEAFHLENNTVIEPPIHNVQVFRPVQLRPDLQHNAAPEFKPAPQLMN